MQRLITVLCSIIGLAFFASSAANAQFYVGAHGGANFVQDSDVDGGGVDAEVSFDPGFAVGGLAGYRFDMGAGVSIDVEGEFAYRQNDIDEVSALGFAANGDGEVISYAWMANAWVNWQIGDSGFVPYFGGGLGGVHIDINDAEVAGSTFESESDLVFGGQVGGGLGYQFDEHLVASLDYRFLITEDARFQGLDAQYQNHSVMIGLKYLF